MEDFTNTKHFLKNSSPFWNKEFNDVDYNKIAHSLIDAEREGVKRKERIGNILGVKKNAIRYDKKIPEDLKEFLLAIATTFHLVYNHFNHDFEKTKRWFDLSNLLSEKILPQRI